MRIEHEWAKAVLDTELDAGVETYDDLIGLVERGIGLNRLAMDYLPRISAQGPVDDPVAHDAWFAFAYVAWQHGALTDTVLEYVRSLVSSGAQRRAWATLAPDNAYLDQRVAAVEGLLAFIALPCPEPREHAADSISERAWEDLLKERGLVGVAPVPAPVPVDPFDGAVVLPTAPTGATGRRPGVVAHNGLVFLLRSVDSAAPIGRLRWQATVAAADLVARTVPADSTLELRLGPDASTVPADNRLTFTEEHLGTQMAYVWVGTADGMWNVTATYVLIQHSVGTDGDGLDSGVPVDGRIYPGQPPELVLYNGLSVCRGGNPLSVELRAADFVQRTSPGALLRIREMGDARGVPETDSIVLGAGSTGGSVRTVEIWAGDLGGNWCRAMTYVLVTDENLTSAEASHCPLLAVNGLAATFGVDFDCGVVARDFLLDSSALLDGQSEPTLHELTTMYRDDDAPPAVTVGEALPQAHSLRPGSTAYVIRSGSALINVYTYLEARVEPQVRRSPLAQTCFALVCAST